jgi:3-oxoacyl-[acyl-carrier protein] reductase
MQRRRRLLAIETMTAGFDAANEDDRHVLAESLLQLDIVIDVHVLDVHSDALTLGELSQCDLGVVAEMTSGAGVNHHGHRLLISLRSEHPFDGSIRPISKEESVAVEVNLEGKVALITGGSRGIGRRTAELFGQAGARVVINYLRSEGEASEVAASIGAERSFAVRANVADPDDVRRMIDATVERFGSLDILVNNAATFETNRFDRDDYEGWIEGWRKTFDLNVFGAANASFLALRQMRRQGGGKIIHVSSRAAFRGETEFADYGASKAALVNLTRSMARSLAGENIITTCVAPGFIETEMAAEELARHRAEIEAQIPSGRVGTVDDVAGVILFLASPMADYLAGVTVDINGGSWFQ